MESKKEEKNKIISIRLTAQEYRDFSEIAKMKNQTISEFWRNRLYQTKVIIIKNYDELQRLHADNVRIGNYLIKHTNIMIEQLQSNKMISAQKLVENQQIAKKNLAEIRALLVDSKKLLLAIHDELKDKRK